MVGAGPDLAQEGETMKCMDCGSTASVVYVRAHRPDGIHKFASPEGTLTMLIVVCECRPFPDGCVRVPGQTRTEDLDA